MQNPFDNEEEILAGYNCPICGYPIVQEDGLSVCYKCGWIEDEDD